MYGVIRVPSEKGEEFRRKTVEKKILDTSRKIRKLQTKEGVFLEIPVTEAAGKY
jgi:tRNA wybutosine-synthesizing protein 2